jgi:hypothetical protein
MQIYQHHSFDVRLDTLPADADYADDLHIPARGVDINATGPDDRTGRRGPPWSSINRKSSRNGEDHYGPRRLNSHESSNVPALGPIPITGLNDADLNPQWPLQDTPQDRKSKRLQKEDKRIEIDRNPFQEQTLAEARHRMFGKMETGSAATSLSDTTR